VLDGIECTHSLSDPLCKLPSFEDGEQRHNRDNAQQNDDTGSGSFPSRDFLLADSGSITVVRERSAL
jgi:hypothetical protein